MIETRGVLPAALLALLVLATPGRGRADEPADVKARAAEFSKVAKRETEEVRFHAGENGPPFVLHPDPILRWTNPIVGTVSGGLYLWTVQGRPEVVASDGALFVFVQTTDPQVILLIEARRVEGVPRWHYALARMTHEQLHMRDNAREVWSVPQLGPAGMTDRHAPYTQFYFDLEEAAARPEGR